MIQMRTAHDCGPVALSNYLEVVRGMPAEAVYNRILDAHNFPNRNDIRDDLWDSPPRHLEIAGAIAGTPAGLVAASAPRQVVLVHLGGFRFHWIVLAALAPGAAVWHDGRAIVSTTGPDAPPVGRRVLGYALGGPGRLPWYWSIWRSATGLVV